MSYYLDIKMSDIGSKCPTFPKTFGSPCIGIPPLPPPLNSENISQYYRQNGTLNLPDFQHQFN